MHRAAIALASALFAGAPAAATEPGKDWPDIVGRWRAVAFPDGGSRLCRSRRSSSRPAARRICAAASSARTAPAGR